MKMMVFMEIMVPALVLSSDIARGRWNPMEFHAIPHTKGVPLGILLPFWEFHEIREN